MPARRPESPAQVLGIAALCVGAAVLYGILHDQITVRVCPEYFTIGHPPIIKTKSLTLLAAGWGVIATWWMGVILAFPLIIAARAGKLPKRNVRSLIRPVGQLLAIMALGALVSGIAGYFLGRNGTFELLEPLSSHIPPEKHPRFLADLWAHTASYAIGFFGGLFVTARVLWSRRQMAVAAARETREGGL
jgi:hypothetical protein